MSLISKLKIKHDLSSYYPLFFTIIFIFILFQYSFSVLESTFYDFRVKYDFGIDYLDKTVLIVLDEESDEYLGESYPYTYESHNRLLEKLIRDKPKIINYFVNLPDNPALETKSIITEFKTIVNSYVETGGFFHFATEVDFWGEKLPPMELKQLGYAPAVINIDNAAFSRDDVARRVVLNISGEDTLHLWTANNYRSTQGLSPLTAKDLPGSYYSREGDATFAMLRFGTDPVETKTRIKKVPFHRVRVGNFPEGFFKDKIVLVGPAYLSNASDYILTPFNKEEYKSSKMNVHASIIDSLIQGKTVRSIDKNISYILSIFLAIFLSFAISRLNPAKGLIVTVSVMVALLLSTYFLFSFFGTWLYVSHLVITIFVVYYIWVPFRAIGEYKHRFAIQEETKLLKKVESLKQNFISLMSHDLKTPVAKIAGLADLMVVQDMCKNDEGKKIVSSIVDSTKELNKFITSILDLAKVESSNIGLNLISKDVNTVVEEIVGGLRYEMNDKNVQVETDLSPLYPIHFDLNLMKRVISNLIENAIKYSGENSIVNVKTWDDEKWVYIEIKDNGVGIPPEDIEHIFDKFYRVKNDASHSIKGTGLGLYLVKYFVELHGGTIGVSSEMGQGTQFTIKLKNE